MTLLTAKVSAIKILCSHIFYTITGFFPKPRHDT